ncbi:hypothetical protein K490DRAFT_10276, partial [Saccharata proteae CBS 121410]
DRPKVVHTSRSFTRLDSTPNSPLHRSRASTIQVPIPEISYPNPLSSSPDGEEKGVEKDIFNRIDESHESEAEETEDARISAQLPQTFEDLPVEIRSLAERFLDSLSARVHPTPLSIEELSELFQDFYLRAATQINTHIATLSSRLSRQKSVASLSSSRASVNARGVAGARKGSAPNVGGEQQMLTASEISDRKKARKLLELKRVALEETVERSICEKVYERIYRHRSTDDSERDEKLRSRTAALSVVGIGLRELLGHGEDLPEAAKKAMEEKEEKLPELLTGARESLERMNEEHYPLGKLQHLTAAHKSIVETLSQIFPSSSSADEILPTLIYSLITSRPESLNAVSNLYFIQRFRTASKVDGEAAYCLVNLEAAISFLETVDLSSLRASEHPEGPEKSTSLPDTPRSEAPPMNLGLTPAQTSAPKPALSPTSAGTPELASAAKQPPPPSPMTKQNRRLSNLIQAQTNRIEAASDAARQAVLDSADQALESINSTLDNSFKFVFGRFKEQQQQGGHGRAASGNAQIAQPKTLEDVRKLVSTPPPSVADDDASAASSIAESHDEKTDEARHRATPDAKPGASSLTELLTTRNPLRENSVDSSKSGGSGRRAGFTPHLTSSPSEEIEDPLPSPATPAAPAGPGAGAVESMRNLGNSLNPLRGFGGMNMIPRFGRNTGTPTPPTYSKTGDASKQLDSAATTASGVVAGAAAMTVKQQERAAVALGRLEELSKIAPPVKRFLDVKEAKSLRIGEVDELLRDYQRLAAALRAAIS